jgi:hypothetical protein
MKKWLELSNGQKVAVAGLLIFCILAAVYTEVWWIPLYNYLLIPFYNNIFKSTPVGNNNLKPNTNTTVNGKTVSSSSGTNNNRPSNTNTIVSSSTTVNGKTVSSSTTVNGIEVSSYNK